jgi:hypothetical protein
MEIISAQGRAICGVAGTPGSSGHPLPSRRTFENGLLPGLLLFRVHFLAAVTEVNCFGFLRASEEARHERGLCPPPSLKDFSGRRCAASHRHAIDAATKGLNLDRSQIWIAGNLTHGYLFANLFEQARKIYNGQQRNAGHQAGKSAHEF